ncbi:MAG TPA: hypothetical protein VHC98_00740 [Candidatus Saccharimonadales bacterium]|nr:hypothetical protein [Candidatus Saccharimonadales bacterium]
MQKQAASFGTPTLRQGRQWQLCYCAPAGRAILGFILHFVM